MATQRIRSLKPELWRDQKLQTLPLGARLLFIGLISYADDEGRLQGEPSLLRASIFPADDYVTQKRFNDWLEQLATRGLVRAYTAEGHRFIDLPKWKKHQKIDRPSPSEYPSYDQRDKPLNGIAQSTSLR